MPGETFIATAQMVARRQEVLPNSRHYLGANPVRPSRITPLQLLVTVPPSAEAIEELPSRLLALTNDHNARPTAIKVLGGQHFLATFSTQQEKEHAKKSFRQAALQVQDNHVYYELSTVHSPLGSAEVATSVWLPNDPAFPGNGGIAGQPEFTQTYATTVRLQGAWHELALCGLPPQGAPTAVLDGGVQSSHPDLGGRIDRTQSVIDGAGPTEDTTGHGTSVIGIMAATTNNSAGLAGITWQGKVTSIKVSVNGQTTTADLLAGLEQATKGGAKVINISLGTPNGSDPALDQALAEASQSAVIVAAAGNQPDAGVFYPASHPDVIAVGAVGEDVDELACYSARSTTVVPRELDLVAPGGGGSSLCSEIPGTHDLLTLDRNGYAFKAGTSLSAPMVSAVAALVRAANPRLSAQETREILKSTADRSNGLPLLNAEAAVKAALAK